MKPGSWLGLAVAMIPGLCAHAHAQDAAPDPANPATPEFNSSLIGDQVEMRDARSGNALVVPKGIPLWDDKNNPASLPPDIEFVPFPDGFDVVYTFDNTSNQPRTLGALNIGILTLGPRIDYPDLRTPSDSAFADLSDGFRVRQAQYPDALYSPAWVLQNKDYAVGISLQYPILDYKHNIRLSLAAPEGKFAQGEGGRGWRVEFLLSSAGNEPEDSRLLKSAVIEPGETRVYTLSIRATRTPAEWVRTLSPYREWLLDEYGGVDYTRRTGPVALHTLADAAHISADNPLGFIDSRPDLDGWKQTIVAAGRHRNWETVIFQSPSGADSRSDLLGPPGQFTSNWNSASPMAAAADPTAGLARLPATGQRIGFWWGRSLQTAAAWDSAPQPMITGNADHRRRALAEVDGAVKAGATTIILDSFLTRHAPIWDQIEWLHELKDRFSAVRFVVNPAGCDLIHREAPAIYPGVRDRSQVKSPDQIDALTGPHLLADFLLPGHESWAAFRWTAYADFGVDAGDKSRSEQLRRAAGFGFVPFALEPFDLKGATIEAAASWDTSIPHDLRLAAQQNGEAGENDEPLSDDPFPSLARFDAAFKARDPATDLNGDGILNLYDYTAWQSLHRPEPTALADPFSKEAPKAKSGKSRSASKSPARRPSRGRRVREPRMEITITTVTAPQGPPAPGQSHTSRRFMLNASPVSFTDAEIAAALARAKGFDEAAMADAQQPQPPGK